ncbi:Protein PHOTOPERIOD-INDEPENDENT EARLY FLOWERING 1 [Picochlorum sp. SENEW3]|nr:Protein PHOTOPERIOD-INDEPENDENT EARLY FLOWERING 1 [Picochlorum sp. SENEW3]WPT15601.1 Protein PHOTOPERIOD-INDEPENDENT EARLY FLOWERING 1 [Picochlorum sp. SENEW3]
MGARRRGPESSSVKALKKEEEEEVVDIKQEDGGFDESQGDAVIQKKWTIEELQYHLQREMEEEDKVLRRAERIKQEVSKMRLPAAPEPKRGKTHWDNMLQEMSWLAKEFQKERRWKIQSAKRLAGSAQRSNMDVESRNVLREKEEEKNLRKRAAWIAKEVMALWNKAHKVVAFKVKNEIDARKKQVLDKQMDVLLKQTHKYSILLAERLRGENGMAGQVEDVSQGTTAGGGVTGEDGLSENEYMDEDDGMDYRSGEDDDADDEATLEEEERMAAAEFGEKFRQEQMDENVGLAADAELPLEKLLERYGYPVERAKLSDQAGPSRQSSAPLVSSRNGGRRLAEEFSELPDIDVQDAVDPMDEDEYKSDEDDDADDERTLEEEEQLALAESGKDIAQVHAEERAGLEDDAHLPLEDLLARYKGYKPELHNSEDQMSENLDLNQESDLEMLTKDNIVVDLEEDEYRSGEDDDADDEETLEEEERMALAESGKSFTQLQAEEAAGLKEDADLPLEELLAKYKGYRPQTYNDRQDIKGLETSVQNAEDEKENTGMSGALEAMAAAQPTGYTLATANVKTPIPFLLKGELREYQHIGLDWLVTLYHKHLNGILADEMGLGKTIQTIALLSWLACERGDWGPHLIVVPTSVMLNWEMEFKRWCPAFKLLTYYGTPKERAAKRQGWSKPNAFHVCITSYTLILQDARMFRRKKWKYLILDEAHMIKNWKSQRWQTLLNFNSKRRLLITGTPLQNDLMELWSLMHFLMPQVFASHAQFKDWFSNPLTGMVEGSAEYNKAIVHRLHSVLRPFLLRRLKKDVEKQLPAKHEHVIKCRLSKRQRQLYEEYVSQSDTRNVLASGNFLGIMNCLMQLRKVCNHPDLFEGRPIISAFDMDGLEIRMPSLVIKDALRISREELEILHLKDASEMCSWEKDALELVEEKNTFLEPETTAEEDLFALLGSAHVSLLGSLGRTPSAQSLSLVSKFLRDIAQKRKEWRKDRAKSLGDLSLSRMKELPTAFGQSLRSELCIVSHPVSIHERWNHPNALSLSSNLLNAVKLPEDRSNEMNSILKNFVFVIPKARSAMPQLVSGSPQPVSITEMIAKREHLWNQFTSSTALLHVPRVRQQLFFPDKRLIQYDCGKLQELARLLTRLKSGGHRALIFTQMSKMLDVLEAFLNIHGHTYVRLDGATKPEARQMLMQRFNTNPKIFCFILSTRSGGVGMNLTGADTVIFYDSDWNPAMDAQAQDRCHRIGQTREVHIYRLISEHTIEENILRKSDQKRELDFLAIQSGGFTTDILYGEEINKTLLPSGQTEDQEVWKEAMRAAEDEGDAAAAAAAEKETAAEMEEFTRDIPPAVAPSEEEKSKEDSEGNTEQTAPKEEEDDEVMKEVVRMAHLDDQSHDPMQALDNALRPIERYAVRFIENYSGKIDKDALTAEMEAAYKVEQFDIEAIEEAEEEREADIDDDEEANAVSDWDQMTANQAYTEQIRAAEEEEKRRAEAEAVWLEQQMLLNIPEAPKRGKVGRPRKVDTVHEGPSTTQPAVEPEAKPDSTTVENARKVLMFPWDAMEDLVLTTVVSILLNSGETREDFIWNTASGALAAGCAATSVASCAAASRKGKLRSKDCCRNRYKQLRMAYMAAKCLQTNDIMVSEQYLQKLLAPAIQHLDEKLKESEKSRGEARTAMSAILKALDSRQDSKISNTLAIELHAIRTGTSRWSALINQKADTTPAPLLCTESKSIAHILMNRCGEQASKLINARLPSIIQAATLEQGYMA